MAVERVANLDAKTQALLRKAQRVARIGFWEVDLVNQSIFWSDITKEIHEVSKDYVPNLSEGINFYKEGKHRDKLTKLVNKGIEQGKPWDDEFILVTAKGNEVWVRAKGEAELVNGKAIRLFGTFQDIDVRKRSQLQYEMASERLALATKTAKMGVWDYDVQKNELVWDDNMFELYGVKREDFTGEVQAWESTVHPDDKERGVLEVQLAIEGKKDFDTEFRIVKPGGEIRHIQARAAVTRAKNGDALKMVGINWDITELKTTKLQLQRTEESLTGAFENSSIGMALVGLDGSWINVNDSLCRSLGYSREEFMKLTFQDITVHEDLEKDLKLLHELVNGKRETYTIEKRYYHKNERIIYALLTVTGVYKIDGSLSHFISQIADITSLKEAENNRKQLYDVMQEQNKNLLNFAHIVSHNLRSHSTNIGMLIDLIKDEKNIEEIYKILPMLASAAGGLRQTVHHLNEVVDIRTNVSQKMKSISLDETLEKVLNDISALIEKEKAEIEINVSTAHYVNAVPAYMESILLNLLTNSLKYRSHERTPKISIDSLIEEDKIKIRFSDNGLGIDLKRHGKKIFGMFKTFHRHKEAKGIGLFITKNQIEGMGGKIEVESTVNEGTTFILTLQRAGIHI